MLSAPSYPRPGDEAERLRVLRDYGLLDTAPEKEFDDLVELAARIFNVPICLVSLVDADRQYFKARVGLDACETSRDGSFCTYTILDENVLVVLDARTDQRFASSPFVTGAPHIRFYAGAPLVAPSGSVIGSLCLNDTSPRDAFPRRDREVLAHMARLVMERMELRRLERCATDGRRRFESIAAASPDAIVCATGDNVIVSWNAAAGRMFGYAADEVVGRTLDLLVPKRFRSRHVENFRHAASAQRGKKSSPLTFIALRRDGEEFPVEVSLSEWSESGMPMFGASVRDITDRREEEARLRYAAQFDYLTDLANRTVLAERMEGVSRDAVPATVILLDLDGFKDVNDSLGHAAGDEVLKVVAGRLLDVAGPDRHFVCRLGGDEFVVFLAGSADPIYATALGERLIAEIERPIEVGERSIYVGASGGVALGSREGWRPAGLLEDADLALYRAKDEGRRAIRLFTPDMGRIASMRTSASSGMRQAWDRQEFELYYQPQVNLADRSIAGAEALIRWNHPERGVVAPAAFLGALETSLIAVPVSEWILRTACEQASLWRRGGFPDFRIGVNVFSAQFKTGDLPEIVAKALDDFDLPAHALELEITENIILDAETQIGSDLAKLREMGVLIAFDDYGTGFASLTMLKDYPVTRLKIDRSFVSGVGRSQKDQTVVEAISVLAKGFHLDVIAEGIETAEQAELMRHHCAEGQGYLFGRPMPACEFERTLGAVQLVNLERAL